jgi:uncharacterized protein YbjT (DUF2867 family)
MSWNSEGRGVDLVQIKGFLHNPSVKTCTKAACLRNPALCENVSCQGLPTRPKPEIGRILVTGASGYVGGRLIVELLNRGYQVRAMVRRKLPTYAVRWPGVEVVEADALKPDSLRESMRDVRIAYYLIHSMMLGPQSFSKSDLEAAHNFAQAAQTAGVERIIYLGGLGERHADLSEHLRNRMEVAEVLRGGTAAVTILRAAVILGSGSASFEIMQHLVSVLRMIFVPKWANSRCQPIAVRDVMKYLIGVVEAPGTAGGEFDIGGVEIMSYRQMLESLARLLNRHILLVRVPISDPRLYGYFVSLLTPVPAPLVSCLMESLRNDVVCQGAGIRTFLPFKTMPFDEAIRAAIVKSEQDTVETRWSDAYPPGHEVVPQLDELTERPRFVATYSMVSEKPAEALFLSFCRVGGRNGWFRDNWMWRIRGMIDRILMGVGDKRGRKHHSFVELGEVIDFWRVEDLSENQRLLLRAEMKIPGQAWLEFKIVPAAPNRGLVVSAYFAPRGLLGSFYWYLFLPFHRTIFKDLIQQIDARA